MEAVHPPNCSLQVRNHTHGCRERHSLKPPHAVLTLQYPPIWKADRCHWRISIRLPVALILTPIANTWQETPPVDCAVLIQPYGMCFPQAACCIQAEHPKNPWLRRVFHVLYRSYCFLYPHFGHTPFSFSAMPQRGQRSKVPSGLYS